MKKKTISFLCFGALLGSVVHGDEQPKQQNLPVEEKEPNHFYFGPEFLCYQLNIHVKDIRVHGARFFWGFRIGYEYFKPDAFYAGVDLLGTGTETDFNASKDERHFSWHKADRGFGNLEARFGYTFAPPNWMIAPFLGGGMYNIYAVDHHNHQGFEENLPYATAGVHSKYTLGPRFNIGFNLKAFHTFGADQRFKFKGGRKETHENMWGGEISIPFIWQIGSNKRWDIQLDPYFLKLDFSEVQNVYGMRLLFGYRF